MLEQLSSFLFLQLSFEGVFWAVAGLGKIAVGTVLYGVRFAVAELVCHGVVAALAALVRFLRSLTAIGIIVKMVAGTFFWHCGPFSGRDDELVIHKVGYPESLRQAMLGRICCCNGYDMKN